MDYVFGTKEEVLANFLALIFYLLHGFIKFVFCGKE